MMIEHMHKSGALIDTTKQSPKASKVSSNSGKEADADRNKKRKAVAPVKQTATKTPPKEDDFLGLSDEEFMKKYAVR